MLILVLDLSKYRRLTMVGRAMWQHLNTPFLPYFIDRLKVQELKSLTDCCGPPDGFKRPGAPEHQLTASIREAHCSHR